MRRIDEDENDDTDSVHRYTTLDGANDGWTSWIQRHTRGKKVGQTGAELYLFLGLSEQ